MAKRIDKELMRQPGRTLTLLGETFPVGLQTPWDQLEKPSGTLIRLDANGSVLENKDLRGIAVEVRGSDCIIRNCRFNATSYHTVRQLGSGTGLVLELSTFDGEKSSGSNADYTYSDVKPMTTRQCVLLDCPSDFLNCSGGLITKNFMAGAGYASGAHADAISQHTSAGGAQRIELNYIDMVTPDDARVEVTNAALKIVAHFGAIRDVVATRNVLLGGGYTIYVQMAEKGASKVTVDGNYVGLGKWGDLYPNGKPADLVYTNNQDFEDAPDDICGVGGEVQPPDPPDPEPGPQPDVDLAAVAAGLRKAAEGLSDAAEELDP